MNKRQKEVINSWLKDEKQAIDELKKIYEQSLNDITLKIRLLQADELTQSKIYQLEYQKALKKQISAVLDNMNANQYTTIQEYLKNAYHEGFLGTMYDLQGQGIPLVFPINQEQIVKAIINDTKLSKSMYESLGFNVNQLKKEINVEITRGISGAMSVSDIARNIRGRANVSLNKSIRIARTESHRIQTQATYDAQMRAKESGADIVKQWDSTMDKKTRPHHNQLDGQIRELDEPFEVAGHKAMYPGGFGIPHEDINCRCVLLQRARWALGEDEVTKMDNEAKKIIKIKEKDFENFKKAYNESVEKVVKQNYDILGNTTKLKNTMSSEDYKNYTDILSNHSNANVKKLYANYADKINEVKFKKNSGAYNPGANIMEFGYECGNYKGRNKFSTLAHEYAHYFDAQAKFKVSFKEIDGLNEAIKNESGYSRDWFKKAASSSDEFLEGIRKDKDYIKKIWSNDLKKELYDHDASVGVQDAINGMFGTTIKWHHGAKYYNRKYNATKSLDFHKIVQKFYKSFGLDASSQAKVSSIVRNYETASEAWANILSAIVCGGEELEYVKKYMPNSYEALLKILEGIE